MVNEDKCSFQVSNNTYDIFLSEYFILYMLTFKLRVVCTLKKNIILFERVLFFINIAIP